jgi:hypothetical protein
MAKRKGKTGLMSREDNRQLVLDILRESGDMSRASAAVGYSRVDSLNVYLDNNPLYKKECDLAVRQFQTRKTLVEAIVDATELAHDRIKDKTATDSLLKEFVFHTPNKYVIGVSIPKNINALALFEEALAQLLYAHTKQYITLPLNDLLKVGETLIKISPTGFILMQFFSQFLDLFEAEEAEMDEEAQKTIRALLDKFKSQKLDELLSRAHTLREGIDAAEVLNDGID